MRSSVTETVLALSLAFRTGNITTRATHAATELGALLLQFPPWPARAASVVSAHTAEQIISVVTIQTADRPAAVAVALAVVSEALRRPAASPSR